MSLTLTAPNTLLREVKRNRKGGTAKLTFPLTAKIAKSLEWPELPEGTKGWTPEDAELRAKTIELTPNNDELLKHAMQLDCTLLGSFQIIRKQKKAGKDSVKSAERITEVLCTVEFADPNGCAKLEQYLQNAARSKMRVVYDPPEVQEELPGAKTPQDDRQGLLSDEARAAVEEMPTGELEKQVQDIAERRKKKVN